MGDAEEVGAALDAVTGLQRSRRGVLAFLLPRSIPTPANVRFRQAIAQIDRVVYRIITERRASGRDEGDVLSMLLEAQDEGGVGMSDQQLRDEVMTLFLAGHETSALGLTWACFLLAQHPEAEATLRWGGWHGSRRWAQTASTARSLVGGRRNTSHAFSPASSIASSTCQRSSVRLPDPLVMAYLAAIAVANFLVSRYGPTVAVLNAFLFIGLDLSSRDRLHEWWQGRAFWPKMLLLIGAGGLLSWLLGGSGQVALASAIAFAVAGIADTLVYRALGNRAWFWRVNGSNLADAAEEPVAEEAAEQPAEAPAPKPRRRKKVAA